MSGYWENVPAGTTPHLMTPFGFTMRFVVAVFTGGAGSVTVTLYVSPIRATVVTVDVNGTEATGEEERVKLPLEALYT